MDTTRAQQQALDDELVAPADRLKIGKSNLRLSSILKSKEPTLQVALDALKLTLFYHAFEISADVPEIYMQEDMLKIYPKLPGQIFKEPPLEEEILSFIRDLRHTGEIKFLSDVNIPKPKTTKKKADSESSPKTKSTQASKGLTVLSEVALTEAQQMKIAIERSKIQTHSSHASGSGDGVDIQSKVPDEQQQNISGTNEGAGDKPKVPDVPEYRLESEEESWTYSQGEDDEDNSEHDSENNNDDEDDDQENVSGETESDNDGDDFVHPNLSTYVGIKRLLEVTTAQYCSHQKSTDKSSQIEEPIHTVEDSKEPAHQEFDTGFTKDQPVDDTTQHPDWFQTTSAKHEPTPDCDCNKTLPAAHGPNSTVLINI
ncbi:hypothetical protein Tco_0561228 [Tanacetum coccineum]